MSEHIPVMLDEVMQYLAPEKDKLYIDATFGGGGYSKAILKKESKVCAIDRDSITKKYSDAILTQYPDAFEFRLGRFSNLLQIAQDKIGITDGIIFDIGTSAMQIDDVSRGFSFSAMGPLDMRMGSADSDLSASIVVNQYDQKRLSDIIFQNGGEKKSRKIAKAIVQARPISTSKELADIILSCTGYYKDNIHPATRTFQAIRIEVNDELNEFHTALEAASKLLRIGGKIITVTFHSEEDRIAKQFFRKMCGITSNPNKHMLPQESDNDPILFKLITKKAIAPSVQEVRQNPRARSAKLRVMQRNA